MEKNESPLELAARLEKVYELTKSSLVEFRKIVLLNSDKEVESAPFHEQWSDILLRGTTNVAIEGHRESAKTQYILRTFPLYALRFPRQSCSYIVIIKNNTDLARGKLREIEQEYISNPELIANMVKIREQSSDVFSVDVRDEAGEVINVRVEAFGKSKSIRGIASQDRRPHIAIIDDPQDTEDAKSDTIMENDWTWFLSDIKFLGKHTRIFLIGNNLGEKSIIERVFANAPELNFETYKIPVERDGIPAWPAKDRIEDIYAERDQFRKLGKIDVWYRERMCIAVAEESRVIHKEDFRYYAFNTKDKIREGANVFFTIDPASSTEKESCYRAIVVNAVTHDNNWMLMDLPYGRWDSAALIDVLFDKVVQWKPMEVGIEKGMFKQVIEPFIYKEMSRRNVFFSIVPIEHAKAGSKLERVKMLGPRYKAHSIWHPDDGPWIAELESELLGVTKDGFKSLYVDLIDALAMQEQICKIPFKAGKGQNLPRTAPVNVEVS